VTEKGPVAIIALDGEEDTRTSESFGAVFRECFERGCFNIIVDLGKLEYLGGRLRKVLLANTKEALAAQGEVKLLSPQPALTNFLKDHHLLDFFEVHNVRQVALRSFENALSRKAEGYAVPSDVSGDTARSLPESAHERLDRLERSLTQLVWTLCQRGVITKDDEDAVLERRTEETEGID
jgi:anti-anti-sigma factor